ncbi:hypothetical protein MRX96_022616 [Rhipicephalus microplus]
MFYEASRATTPQTRTDSSIHHHSMGHRQNRSAPSPTTVRVRELVTRPPQRNRTSAGDEPGQRHPDDATQDAQVQDERSCIVLWVVGAAFTFPLILSAWLVLVPFLVRANWTTTSTTPLFSLTPQHTMHTMPSTCIVPVTWSALPPSLNASVPYSFGPSKESLRRIFCLYNNTLYWLVGIADGNLKSRQPSFDEQYGLHLLREVADSFNFKALKILLAVGGYPEDAPHFSRLGWDIDAMNSLMRDVVDSVDRFGLNGITVHWAEAHDGCTGTDDITVFKTLLSVQFSHMVQRQDVAGHHDHRNSGAEHYQALRRASAGMVTAEKAQSRRFKSMVTHTDDTARCYTDGSARGCTLFLSVTPGGLASTQVQRC